MDHIFTGANWNMISRRLRTRLLLFLAIAIALLLFAIYSVIEGQMSWWMGLITLLIGGVLGFIYGRLIRVHWNERESKIVTQMDAVGFAILAIYILFDYFRDTILSDFFTGALLTALGLTLAGGILIGRFFGVHVSLMRMIRQHREPTRTN